MQGNPHLTIERPREIDNRLQAIAEINAGFRY
jgi:hypothetical protein